MVVRRPEVPVLYPTLEELGGSFEAYIEKHERKIAEFGICKIVPPPGWTPRKKGYSDDLDLTIDRAIRQHATGKRGLYRALYLEQHAMSLKTEFKPIALDKENQPPANSDPQELERKYWKYICLRPPLYGADVPGSLFDERLQGWNLRDLHTMLSRVLEEGGHSLPGVNTPYLYFGMWRATFAWHTEDLDLYSVNYLHFGAPKQWYAIPPDHRQRFETVVKGLLPDLFRACPEFFRHKELIISPQLLDQYQIPYVKTIQQPHEFVINYPGAYHAGFNHGYNCAESVNFATKRWIPVGARANVCTCDMDSVKIDMKLFRHLVAKRLLPKELFVDSDPEEEELVEALNDTIAENAEATGAKPGKQAKKPKTAAARARSKAAPKAARVSLKPTLKPTKVKTKKKAKKGRPMQAVRPVAAPKPKMRTTKSSSAARGASLARLATLRHRAVS